MYIGQSNPSVPAYKGMLTLNGSCPNPSNVYTQATKIDLNTREHRTLLPIVSDWGILNNRSSVSVICFAVIQLRDMSTISVIHIELKMRTNSVYSTET